MRAFLAVPCGDDFARELSTALDPLRQESGWRWSPPEQYHLTLSFLGDWPTQGLNDLRDNLLASSWPGPFELTSDGLAAFPNLRRPRVLFVQMVGDDALKHLAEKVRSVVTRTWPGSPADFKPFRSHLTVARSRDRGGANGFPAPRDFLPETLPTIGVQEFHLVKSQLKSTGAEHTILERILL